MKFLMNWVMLLLLSASLFSCKNAEKTVPVVAFLDAFEDNTIAQARKGFFDALSEEGYSEQQKTIKMIYRNAQGDIPKLTLSVQYFLSEKADLIATCPSLSTISALQHNKEVPVFMMVAPTPALLQVVDAAGNAPKNLLGVGENLDYIDTSFALIPQLIKAKGAKLRVGVLYNQSEPQSTKALERLQQIAVRLNTELVPVSVSSSADVSLTVQALLAKNIDAFFANPDNVVFSSFENIIRSCNTAHVPVFTSEAGLVARGAVAAYGADIYQWGYQAGKQAATFLKNKNTNGLQWEMVKVRKRVYNAASANSFQLSLPTNFEAIQ